MNTAERRSLARRFWPVWPLLILLLILLLWDWNWFRPLVERQASAALNRPVSIADLDVKLSWHPQIVLSGVTLANPPSFPADDAPLAAVGRLALRIGIRDLFDHRVNISELEIDRASASARQGPRGLRNWQLSLPASDPAATPWDVQIAGLKISDGRFSFVDATLKANVSGHLATGAAAKDGEAKIIADAAGQYNGQPFKARFSGGSVLALRTPENPYPVDLKAENGDTQIALGGTLLDPLQFGGAHLRLLLKGPDLSALADITQLPLPKTPPYKLEGELDYRESSILFRKFTGLVGESDMAGDISVRLQKPRPVLQADVRSKQLRLVDLAGLIGADPNAPPATAPGGSGRVLPSSPIELPRLRTADVRFNFSGASIVGDKLPFDRLDFKLTIDDGVMRVSPADFGIGDGALRLYATLDPRGDQLGMEGRAELKRVDIANLLERSSYKGSGRIGGIAEIRSKGHSLAELLGNGDGDLKLAMVGGDFSAVLLDLAGLDFGNATLSLLGITPRTEVRCFVADFELKKGLMDTQSFVLDTGTTNLLLDGGASFKDETLDLRLRTQPKRANILRLKAPIYIKGSFAEPTIRPDFVDLGVRTASAVALGVLLTPLAAVLPTLQLGPGEDRDCKALLTDAETTAPAQPRSK